MRQRTNRGVPWELGPNEVRQQRSAQVSSLHAQSPAAKLSGAMFHHSKVPVIRNCGSNTLNFEFHDTAARTVQNGISQPQKTSQWNSAYNWYPTWPAKEIRPLKSQAAPDPCPTAAAASPAVNGPPQPGWSATWTKDARRKEKRWVKYDGIGPVDESGMPIASRSSVDSPRDWYRSMFQQIHSKLPEPELDQDFSYKFRGSKPPGLMTKGQSPALTSSSSSCQQNGLDWRNWEATDAAALEPRSIFDYEPGKSSILDYSNLPKKPLAVSLAQERPSATPIEEQLAKELQQLSEELDKDIKAIEMRHHGHKSLLSCGANRVTLGKSQTLSPTYLTGWCGDKIERSSRM
ncbi:Vinexin [Varanus komodoensis]|nr:Vinexin [Varanus komodoensis]